VPIVAALAAVFVVAFLVTAGEAAGHALWLPIVLAVLAAAVLGAWLWHRREVERIHHLHHDQLTHWLRVEKFRPWPKWCQRCGYRVHTWRELSAHDSNTSPCALLDQYQASLEGREAGLPPGMGWKVADVEGQPNEDQADELAAGPQPDAIGPGRGRA
jgi:hypothetical protein